MFCKVMTIDNKKRREEFTYQCDRVTFTFNPDDSGDFVMHVLNGQSISYDWDLHYEDYENVQVFLMNDDGQTIDRHGWRKQ